MENKHCRSGSTAGQASGRGTGLGLGLHEPTVVRRVRLCHWLMMHIRWAH